MKFGLALSLLAAFAVPAWGQSLTGAGQAMPLENLGASARAMALGSAFVSVADDSSSLFWNAAGLARMQTSELALHHNQWLGGIQQDTIVMGIYSSVGSLGIAVNNVDYGSIEGRDASGALTSSYGGRETGITAGWGMPLSSNLMAGLSIKSTQQGIANSTYFAYSMDLGALWQWNAATSLGAALNNLGTSVSGSPKASALRLGGSWRTALGADNSLLLAAAGNIELAGTQKLELGAEDTAFKFLALRAGYEFSAVDNEIQGLSGLTLGLGFMVEDWVVDYAFLMYGDLGASNRISLAYKIR